LPQNKELRRRMVKIQQKKAFTLVEILVALIIIGILATIVLLSVLSARIDARCAKRSADLSTVKKALDLYYTDHNNYPLSGSDPDSFVGESTWDQYLFEFDSGWTTFLGIYLESVPKDPLQKLVSATCNATDRLCISTEDRIYGYASDGVDYKIYSHAPENCAEERYKDLVDPKRDSGTNENLVEYTGSCWAWSYYTPGARTW